MLEEKIKSRSAKIAIIGLGYVGIPLLKAVLDKGFSAIAIDCDASKVEAIQRGHSYLNHIDFVFLKEKLEMGVLELSTSFECIAQADIMIVCVPTPLVKNKEPDLSYVMASFEAMLPHRRKGQLYILESTTYPGTTDSLLAPLLGQDNFKLDEDLFLAFSPEREDPGNKTYGVTSIPKLIGGIGLQSAKLAEIFYSTIVEKTYLVKNARIAEAAKLTENIFRSVNIALVNELKVIYTAMGIDIWEVIEAARTKPFGYMPFYPGPGSGGHCIPIDPHYLSWRAKEYGVEAKFIELAGEVNDSMPTYVVAQSKKALGELREKKILLLGVAYKKNIGDARETPALPILKLFEKEGAMIDYYDPYIPFFEEKKSLERLTEDNVASYDGVVLITDHDEGKGLNYSLIQKKAKVIIDTRNIFERSEKVFRA